MTLTKTKLALALGSALVMQSGTASAAVYDFAGTFEFINNLGVLEFTDTAVTGQFNMGTGTGAFTSPTPFNGQLWNAEVDQMFPAFVPDPNDTAGNLGWGVGNFAWTTTTHATREWNDPNDTTLGHFADSCRIGTTLDGCAKGLGDGTIKIDKSQQEADQLGILVEDLNAYTMTDSGSSYSANFPTLDTTYNFSMTNLGQFAAGVFFDWNGNATIDIAVMTVLQVTNGQGTFDTNGDHVLTVEGRQSDGATVGGIPMIGGPFPEQTAAFKGTMTCDGGAGCPVAPAVPVPAAAWLFGSGLLGLVGVARRRKA